MKQTLILWPLALLSMIALLPGCRTLLSSRGTMIRTYRLTGDDPAGVQDIQRSIKRLLTTSGLAWNDERDKLTIIDKTIVIRSTQKNHDAISRLLEKFPDKKPEPRPDAPAAQP